MLFLSSCSVLNANTGVLYFWVGTIASARCTKAFPESLLLQFTFTRLLRSKSEHSGSIQHACENVKFSRISEVPLFLLNITRFCSNGSSCGELARNQNGGKLLCKSQNTFEWVRTFYLSLSWSALCDGICCRRSPLRSTCRQSWRERTEISVGKKF